MKTVLRQDGSPIELSDEEAERWVGIGLATYQPEPAVTGRFNKSETPQTIEGESV